MTFLDTIILGILEGLTEFLPVSSTGHLVLVSHFLDIPQTEFLKSFEIAIQLGSILAMVFFYFRQITNWKLYPKIITAFLPTAVIGFMAYGFIKSFLLESPLLVASMLILGGIVLLLLNSKIETTSFSVIDLESISYKNAFLIGLSQCFAMIPGVSRSAATILGGIFNGFDKRQATEFSFLLAIPTMLAATGYDLLKTSLDFSSEEWSFLGVGFLTAFLVALLAIKTFLEIVKHFSFAWFGWYRIALGLGFFFFFYI